MASFIRDRLPRRITGFTKAEMVRALWLGIIVGIAAGIVGIIFFELLELTTEYVLLELTGYHPPQPFGEGGEEVQDATRPWLLPIVVGLGGLASGAVLTFFTPGAPRHGMDDAIYGFHHREGKVDWRSVPAMLLGSVLTIGSGGAAGSEGPAASIGSGLGSNIAGGLGLSVEDRRRALVAGMGAGMGAVFRAPLGGAMMAVESLYKHDLEADAVLLSLVSAIVSFSIFGAVTSFDPLFGDTAGFKFDHPEELVWYLLLGLACGVLGLVYQRSLAIVHDVAHHVHQIPTWVKAGIGGAAVGAIGMFAPEAIHVGYGWVQHMLHPDEVMDFSLWLIIALPLLRILTASLSIGAGAAGGIFAPGMVAGGMFGALFWRLLHDAPGMPVEPAPMVIIGMIAVFGSVAHVPLAMMLMVGEMTGNLSLLAPAMVSVAVATLVVGNTTVFGSQVNSRSDSPAHRFRFAVPLLDTITARQAVVVVPTVPSTFTVGEALAALSGGRRDRGVVVDDANRPVGGLSVEGLRAAPDAGAPVGDFAASIRTTVQANLPLDQALLRIGDEGQWVPVVEGSGSLVGIIDTHSVVDTYNEIGREVGDSPKDAPH